MGLRALEEWNGRLKFGTEGPIAVRTTKNRTPGYHRGSWVCLKNLASILMREKFFNVHEVLENVQAAHDGGAQQTEPPQNRGDHTDHSDKGMDNIWTTEFEARCRGQQEEHSAQPYKVIGELLHVVPDILSYELHAEACDGK